MRKSPLTLVLGLAPLLLAGCGGGDEPEQAPPPPREAPAPPPTSPDMAAGNLPAGVTPAMVQEGQQLFGTVCAACHGPGGTGTTLAPNLTDEEWLNISGRNYDEIVQVVQTGVPQPEEHPAPMPPRGGGSFTDDQVRALAAYVYSLGGA